MSENNKHPSAGRGRKRAGWFRRLFFGGSKTLADDMLETDRYGQQKIEDVEVILSPGKQIVKGLTEGVQSEKSSFVDEITQLALAGVQAAKSTLDINSPSRVFREIGNYTGLGFVKGLQDYVDRSYAAGSEMAESAEGGLSGVLQTIADIVSGGFDMEPVIRPVLDLSAVSAGADALNNLFYSQRAVGLVGQAAVAFEAQRSGSSQTTISVDNEDVVAELRTLRGEMASMLERMEKLRVVLNTDALVGELAEPMDVALGQRSTQRGRGI